MKIFSNFLPRIGFAAASAFLFSVSSIQLQAADGYELLANHLDSSDVNKSVIDCASLEKAVTEAVAKNKKSAAAIVGAAVLKTNDCSCRYDIVRNAIAALGDYTKLDKKLIPDLLAAAIRNSSTGVNKAGYDGCECAQGLTKIALKALGENPSEALVQSIVSAASGAVGGDCSGKVVSAATDIFPQYASGIADAGAAGGNNSGAPDGVTDGVAFVPAGNLNAPGAFFPPSAPNGGGVSGEIVDDTTPVN